MGVCKISNQRWIVDGIRLGYLETLGVQVGTKNGLVQLEGGEGEGERGRKRKGERRRKEEEGGGRRRRRRKEEEGGGRRRKEEEGGGRRRKEEDEGGRRNTCNHFLVIHVLFCKLLEKNIACSIPFLFFYPLSAEMIFDLHRELTNYKKLQIWKNSCK
jgi:hypothetical protein